MGRPFYLGGYALLQAGVIRGSSAAYTLMTLVGASLVLLSLSVAFNLSSALIQVSWIAISLIGLTRLALQARGLRFSDDEARLMQGPLAPMPGPLARKLFDAGHWSVSGAKTMLTTEGTPVEALHCILSGRATVYVGQTEVAELTQGFVGELNVMEAGPASAAVVAQTGSEIFSVSGQSLRKLAERDSDFRQCLDRALSRQAAAKLHSANNALAGNGLAGQ